MQQSSNIDSNLSVVVLTTILASLDIHLCANAFCCETNKQIMYDIKKVSSLV